MKRLYLAIGSLVLVGCAILVWHFQIPIINFLGRMPNPLAYIRNLLGKASDLVSGIRALLAKVPTPKFRLPKLKAPDLSFFKRVSPLTVFDTEEPREEKDEEPETEEPAPGEEKKEVRGGVEVVERKEEEGQVAGETTEKKPARTEEPEPKTLAEIDAEVQEIARKVQILEDEVEKLEQERKVMDEMEKDLTNISLQMEEISSQITNL
jgi:hypothetical protein